jgi:hypothetical protein
MPVMFAARGTRSLTMKCDKERFMPWMVSLFDKTGAMARPWVDAGYRAICVDLQHCGETERDGIRFIEANMKNWVPPREVVEE